MRHFTSTSGYRTSFLLGLLLILSFSSLSVYAQPVGQKLFKKNCAVCHKMDKVLTGPALQGWSDRVPEGDWIYEWVKNSQVLIASGDDYANKIYNSNGKVEMTAFPQLSNEDVDAIFTYVDNWPYPVVVKPGEEIAAAEPTGMSMQP